ncbi:guanylate kinase [bacterium]|nr:guanylate kinase [bacterium]
MNKVNKKLIEKNIIIISGPSGAGEDSIISGLNKKISLEKIITTTTRKKRPSEKNGQQYYFIKFNDFKQKIKEGKFIEYAQQYNNQYYGVTKEELLRVANSKKIGIWKIDYKGVINAKKMFPNIKSIFITAPLKELEERIRNREKVSKEYIKERMEYTKEWLKYKKIYDFEITNKNGNLEKSIEKTIKYINKLQAVDN